jgi:hypothetical protein
MAPLTPFNPVLGPNPKYCFPEENVLQMREKAFSLSGDDFTIKTANGAEICKCKGKVMSISDKKGKFFPILTSSVWDSETDDGGHSVYGYPRKRTLRIEEQTFIST